MTRAKLRSLILKRLDELEQWYADDDPDPEQVVAKERDVILEVADGMARAGFPRLYAIGRDLRIDIESKAVKIYLSRCLRALRSKRRAGAKPSDSGPQSADAPLTVTDVGCRLGVSRRVAYELCQDGEINSFKVGRAIRVRPEELAAYIERRTDRGRDALAAHRPNRAHPR